MGENTVEGIESIQGNLGEKQVATLLQKCTNTEKTGETIKNQCYDWLSQSSSIFIFIFILLFSYN